MTGPQLMRELLGHLPEQDTAAVLGVEGRTLRNWRSTACATRADERARLVAGSLLRRIGGAR